MGLKLTEDGHASSEMFYYHPTFLYESLWNALGVVLLHFLSKKRKYEGQMALCYALWYGLGRTFSEGLRTDSLFWGPFRVSQLLAAVSAIAAAWILIWQMFRPHPAEKLYVNRVAAKKAAEAAVIAEVSEEETTEEEHSEKETPVEETEN